MSKKDILTPVFRKARNAIESAEKAGVKPRMMLILPVELRKVFPRAPKGELGGKCSQGFRFHYSPFSILEWLKAEGFS